jgi:hypothetical protein
MLDNFSDHANSLTSPARKAFAITPNDASDLSEITRAIYVGGAGHLLVTMMDGNDVTFSDVPGGTVLPIRARRVKTGSTATNIVGLA